MKAAAHRLLVVLGTLLLLLGTVAGVVHREVLDAGRFTAHVDAVRADPAVSRQLGALITQRILEAQPDLTAVRPLLESTATGVVASPTLGPAVRAFGVGPLYRALTHGGNDTVVLRLADVAAIVIGVVAVAAPEQRAALPAELDVRLSDLGGRGVASETLREVHLVGWLSWVLPLLGLLVLAGAGAASAGSARSRGARLLGALAAVGRGALGAGVGLALLLVLVGVLVRRTDAETLSGAVVRAVWRELGGAFWSAAGVLAAGGYVLVLVVSAARAGDGGSRSAAEVVALTWSRLLDPGPRPGPRARRAGFLLLAGAALVLEPLAVARAVLWGLGLALVVAAGALLVGLGVEVARRGARDVPGRLRATDPQVRGVVVTLAVVGLVAVFVAGALPGHEDLPEAMGSDSATCNGHVELCDRRYDDIAFPATHNAMAAADEPGWFLAEQPDGIVAQLDHGIRVLLVDSWYGQRTQRPGVIANTDQSRAAALAEARQSFGEGALRSALRLRDALHLTPRGPVEPYLCHALCELGSTPWLPVMRQVRTWLAAHPREVVTFFVQDTVSPADTAEVVRRAGLLPYVYTPATDQQWPTLGQMIDSGQRLVILMEQHGGGTAYPWLLDGFHWAQDTPFLFRRPGQFSCRPNRGPDDASLFLLNHWVTDKKREISNATRVNARGVLLPRAEQCQEQRGMIPNFVAVDFYDRGDLFGVVDTLNGLD